jgi:hypothetical protein
VNEPLKVPLDADIDGLMRLTRAIAGVDYCFVLMNNIVKMNQLGWKQLAGAPYCRVADRDCVIMWKGDPAPGASMGSSVPTFCFDEELHGIAYPNREKPQSGHPNQRKG